MLSRFLRLSLGAAALLILAQAQPRVAGAAAEADLAGAVSQIDLPIISVIATDPIASESGDDIGVFQVLRSLETTSSVTVRLALSGTAVNGVDYTTIPLQVVIPAGAMSAPVYVLPLNDDSYEGDETAILEIMTDTTYLVLAPSTASVTIHDSYNFPPTVAPISDDTITLGNAYTSPRPTLERGAGVTPTSWSLVNYPMGMTIDPATGIVAWNALYLQGSPLLIAIRATNIFGSGDASWKLTVAPQTPAHWDLYKIVYTRNGRRVPDLTAFMTTQGLFIRGGGERDTLSIKPANGLPGAEPIPMVSSDGSFNKIFTTVEIVSLQVDGRIRALTAKDCHVWQTRAGVIGNARMIGYANAIDATAPTYALAKIISTLAGSAMNIRLTGVILESLVTPQGAKLLRVETRKYKKPKTVDVRVSLGGVGSLARVTQIANGKAINPSAGASILQAGKVRSLISLGGPITPETISADLAQIRGTGQLLTFSGGIWAIPADLRVQSLFAGTGKLNASLIGGDVKCEEISALNGISQISAQIIAWREKSVTSYIGGIVGFESELPLLLNTDASDPGALPLQPAAMPQFVPSSAYQMVVSTRAGNIRLVYGQMGVYGVFIAGTDESGAPNYRGGIQLIATADPNDLSLPSHSHLLGIFGEARLAPEKVSSFFLGGDVRAAIDKRFLVFTHK
ncbi:MAG: hypothetical protein NTX50_23810 [Candidatus Sumerlaeota bacterium]|nr:hypothetical protein [Candidatus Sumerlaeota bacterium]